MLSSRLDLEQLLSPLSAEHPAGESLRYEGTYDRIGKARREDDPSLSQGIFTSELKRADWTEVENICLEALETRSKDLQLAAWLLESWMHQHGFSGVSDGLHLLRALCEKFWPDLYPELDGEDVEARVSPIVWINEKLSIELKKIPLTAPHADDVDTYCFADWESAYHRENLAKRNQGAAPIAEASGQATPTSFDTSVMLSDKSFYVALSNDLNITIEACLALEQVLDEKCGKDSPSLHEFKATLEMIQRLAAEILRAQSDGHHLPGEHQELQVIGAEYEEPLEPGSSGTIRSRAEAYQRLEEAANYLLRTEPHSPTPYLVKRAVAWESLSLFDLFQQIIRNENELEEINRLLRPANKEGAG
jgi:type VI secretion system protein ImpA